MRSASLFPGSLITGSLITRSLIVLLAALAGVTSACSGDDTARMRYNEALSAYEQGKWEDAAEGFLEARNLAGQDPELRFRAAYNLGLAHARQTDALADAPAGAPGSPPGNTPAENTINQQIDQLRRGAAWFRDAVRLRPDDEGARVNLEVVLRRIQVLADQLNQGQNSLEARLDRVIEDQRGLRDRIRELMQRVSDSGGAVEPVAFQTDFDALATFERGLLADAGTVSDLAGEELGLLQGKPEEERSQEDQVRLVQLQNLDHYLQQARASLADTRRVLRRLQGDKAHRRADAGLAELKRAREQLQDPVTVLQSVARDQVLLLMHTDGLAQLGKNSLTVAPDSGGEGAAPQAPPWLTAEHLGDRQAVIGQRTGEVLARFQAGVDAAAHDQAQAADPKQQRVLAAAGEAIPFLVTATSAMDSAGTALAGARLDEAAARQNEALEALFAAIERFSDIRELIELSYRDHAETTSLLTPPSPDDTDDGGDGGADPGHAAMSTAERAERAGALVTRNLDRMRRLQGLFDDELQTLDAQAAQAAQAGQGATPGGMPGQDAMSPEQIEAAKQQYQQAQALRQQAQDALDRLAGAVQDAGSGTAAQAGEVQEAAAQAMEHIEALRRLFFSIIEHLKELHEAQTETHDRTASGTGLEGEALAGHLGPLVDAQRGHAELGGALAQALAEQADAAAQAPAAQPGQGGHGGDPQEAAQRLAQAAQEVQEANAQMGSAAGMMSKDAENATQMSIDMSPTLDAQQAAMEHLAEAIRLLQPPQQQQQDQQDQQQQDQQQQQQDQQQEVSRQQAQRRLQEIRDREAERQRQKDRQKRFTPEPVEKDW